MSERAKNALAGALALLVTVGIIIGVAFAFMLGIPSYERSQARKNAENGVKVTHIEVSKAHQEALITYAQIEATRAKAHKRIVEAEGIAVATKEALAKLASPVLVRGSGAAQVGDTPSTG